MPIHERWEHEVAEATLDESMAFFSNMFVRVLYRDRTVRMEKKRTY